MTLERYVYAGTKRLRCGYTTGSCAALATQAACRMLLGEPVPDRVAIVTPSGVRVEADVLEPDRAADGSWARCAVRKDGGDDVDATDGLLVFADVRLGCTGAGKELACGRQDEAPADDPSGPRVVIRGGEGVGRVTRPGLEQPVGEAAINSVPRAMIAEQVRTVWAARARANAGTDAGAGAGAIVEVTISVPGGAEAAARTFNPQLGIEGGISILGTTGIVEPRSVAALRDSIELEIRQKAAEGARDLIIVPGNYGRAFVEAQPELAGIPLVSCSNYIGDALDYAVRHGFAHVLLVGHIGKLVKVAGGVMDTHSRTADCRCEIVCAHAALAGASRQTAQRIMACATTEACLDVLAEARAEAGVTNAESEAGITGDIRAAGSLLAPVARSLVEAIADHVARRAAGAFESGVILFSQVRGELARSSAADALIARMREDGR